MAKESKGMNMAINQSRELMIKWRESQTSDIGVEPCMGKQEAQGNQFIHHCRGSA